MLIVIKMQRYGKNSKPPNTLLIIMLKCINKKSHNRDCPHCEIITSKIRPR